MNTQDKIKGIVFAYQPAGETREETVRQLEMINELGITWMRMHVSFPWADRMGGSLSEAYKKEREEIIFIHRAGFEIMVTTPGLGSYRFDEALGQTRWMESFPAFVGEPGSEEFYENVQKACAFICADLGENAGRYWQCMNEIDNPVFASHYSDEIVTRTARASAAGIVSANPGALCGINLSRYCEDALRIADLAYAPGHCFGYIGDDQYFGSWQPGSVEDWAEVIDRLYERYQLPVLANEWGYSSGGELASEHLDPKDIPFGLPEECVLQKWFHEAEGGHTDEAQAIYLEKGLKLFAEHPHCVGSFLFCWRDAFKCYHCGGESCPSEDYWGIVTKNLEKKPGYEAVKRALKAYF